MFGLIYVVGVVFVKIDLRDKNDNRIYIIDEFYWFCKNVYNIVVIKF